MSWLLGARRPRGSAPTPGTSRPARAAGTGTPWWCSRRRPTRPSRTPPSPRSSPATATSSPGISHPYESMPWTAFADRLPRLVRLRSLGGALVDAGRPAVRDRPRRAGRGRRRQGRRHRRRGPRRPRRRRRRAGAAGAARARGPPSATPSAAAPASSWPRAACRPLRSASTAVCGAPPTPPPSPCRSSSCSPSTPSSSTRSPTSWRARATPTAAYAEADRATAIAAWHAVHATSPDGHAAVVVRRHAHQLLRLAAAADPVMVTGTAGARRGRRTARARRRDGGHPAVPRPPPARSARPTSPPRCDAVADLRVDDPGALFAPTPAARRLIPVHDNTRKAPP